MSSHEKMFFTAYKEQFGVNPNKKMEMFKIQLNKIEKNNNLNYISSKLYNEFKPNSFSKVDRNKIKNQLRLYENMKNEIESDILMREDLSENKKKKLIKKLNERFYNDKDVKHILKLIEINFLKEKVTAAMFFDSIFENSLKIVKEDKLLKTFSKIKINPNFTFYSPRITKKKDLINNNLKSSNFDETFDTFETNKLNMINDIKNKDNNIEDTRNNIGAKINTKMNENINKSVSNEKINKSTHHQKITNQTKGYIINESNSNCHGKVDKSINLNKKKNNHDKSFINREEFLKKINENYSPQISSENEKNNLNRKTKNIRKSKIILSDRKNSFSKNTFSKSVSNKVDFSLHNVLLKNYEYFKSGNIKKTNFENDNYLSTKKFLDKVSNSINKSINFNLNKSLNDKVYNNQTFRLNEKIINKELESNTYCTFLPNKTLFPDKFSLLEGLEKSFPIVNYCNPNSYKLPPIVRKDLSVIKNDKNSVSNFQLNIKKSFLKIEDILL